MTSSGANCMYLIRILTLNNLKFNRSAFARYLSTKQNYLSDALSRSQLERFIRLALISINKFPDKLPELIWPPSKIWKRF